MMMHAHSAMTFDLKTNDVTDMDLANWVPVNIVIPIHCTAAAYMRYVYGVDDH